MGSTIVRQQFSLYSVQPAAAKGEQTDRRAILSTRIARRPQLVRVGLTAMRGLIGAAWCPGGYHAAHSLTKDTPTMAINFCDNTGAIDLSLLDEAEVAKLDDERKTLLQTFIGAVLTRIAAGQHLTATRNRVRIAMAAEDAALAAHNAASPPPTFLDIRRAAIAAYEK